MKLSNGMNSCPRCDSKRVGVEAFMSNPPRGHSAQCLDCKFYVGSFDTKDEAIRVWNFMELAFK